MNCLIETALLTHGLRSIANEELAQSWHCPDAILAWVDGGELKLAPSGSTCLSGNGPKNSSVLIVITWRRPCKPVPAVL